MRPVIAKGVKSRESHNLSFFGCFFFVLDVWQNGGSCGLGVELIDYGFPPRSVCSIARRDLSFEAADGMVGSFFLFLFSSFFVQRGRIFIVFSPQEGKGRGKGKGGFLPPPPFCYSSTFIVPEDFFLFQGRILLLGGRRGRRRRSLGSPLAGGGGCQKGSGGKWKRAATSSPTLPLLWHQVK